MDDPTGFAPAILRAARLRDRASVRNLAMRVGLPHSLIDLFERGKRVPTPQQWQAIVEVLGVGALTRAEDLAAIERFERDLADRAALKQERAAAREAALADKREKALARRAEKREADRVKRAAATARREQERAMKHAARRERVAAFRKEMAATAPHRFDCRGGCGKKLLADYWCAPCFRRHAQELRGDQPDAPDPTP